MLPRRSRFALLVTSALTFAAPLAVPSLVREARASVAVSLTLTELVERSEVVVVGLPKSKYSVWESGRIVTYTTVAVDTAVAGAAKAGDSIVVRTLGGAVDGIGQIAHGEAVLALDKPAVLFLRPSVAAPSGGASSKVQSVVGMAQGAMAIEVGADKVARVTARPIDLVLMPKLTDPKAVPAGVTLGGRPLESALKDVRVAWAARAKK